MCAASGHATSPQRLVDVCWKGKHEWCENADQSTNEVDSFTSAGSDQWTKIIEPLQLSSLDTQETKMKQKSTCRLDFVFGDKTASCCFSLLLGSGVDAEKKMKKCRTENAKAIVDCFDESWAGALVSSRRARFLVLLVRTNTFR